MRCDECGFDNAVTNDALVAKCHSAAAAVVTHIRAHLATEAGVWRVRTRPAADVWSALEYAAHLRDVFDFYRWCIDRTVREDQPRIQMIEWSSQADARAWNDEDPARVLSTLSTAVHHLAATLEWLDRDHWERESRSADRSARRRSVRVFAERCAHEGEHHLLDVTRCLLAGGEPE